MTEQRKPKGKVGLAPPISIWQRPIKVDLGKALSILGKGAIDASSDLAANPLGAVAAWKTIAKAGIDALGTIVIETPVEARAWLLIHRSVVAAMAELAADVAVVDLAGGTRLPDALNQLVEEQLEVEIEGIDNDFFAAPAQAGVVAAMHGPFAAWLRWYGVSPIASSVIARRLGGYFTVALHEEWRTHARDYEPLKLALDSPIADAAIWEMAWRRQAAWLNRGTHERVLGEHFCLDDVYVPLRAYYETGSEQAQGLLRFEVQDGSAPNRGRVVVDLESELDAWVERHDKDDSIRVVSGGPGAGKSAFTRMFAARRAAQGDHVVRIPLHSLNVTIDLDAAVGQFVLGAAVLPNNPLTQAPSGKPILLILDGLDELEKQGTAAESVARDFCDHVLRRTESLNQNQLRVQILVSGREIAVQAGARVLRRESAILHLLPYHVPAASVGSRYVDPEGLLKTDQRDVWWQKYGLATGKEISRMPRDLRNRDLDEITTQPLLCYLVALSHAQNKIDFSRGVTLHAIYEDLLHAVYARAYDRRGPHSGVRVLEESEFTRILEEIALAAWHGDGRTTTVREIEAHCESSGLKPLLDRVRQGAESGVTRLLMAFYARGHGTREGHDTFELTHKSFGEYLASRRIVATVRAIAEQRKKQREQHDGLSEKEALARWADLCGPTAMEVQILRFVREQIASTELEVVHGWREELASLIDVAINSGMPMERRLSSLRTFHEASRQSRNAEEALLACWNACARTTRTRNRLGGVEPTTFGNWLRKLQGQRDGSDNVLAMSCLSWLDLSSCTLDSIDLIYADLAETTLESASLWFATLFGARLHRTCFERCSLNFAVLSNVDLLETCFKGALMGGATFGPRSSAFVDAEGSDFSGASMESADLTMLRNANLKDAATLVHARRPPSNRKGASST